MTTSRLPRVVWLLGLVSLCMDLSSEMIHALLPVFLVSTLHASTMTLGLIEGLAEGTASIARVFSGVLSDRIGLRKPLVVLGYGMAALTKPLFPLANSAGWVLCARVVDRIGKGIRGAPRDALVADVTPIDIRGAAYGLRQALDTAGALLGPLAAILLMAVLSDNVRGVFWVAVLPAVVAVTLLVFGLEEPTLHAGKNAPQRLPHWRDLRIFGTAFWAVVAIGAVFTLARFSEAFLVLRAYDAGLSYGWTPLALAVMNLTYVASAYPAGRLSDRLGRVLLLMIGMAVLIVADVVLAVGTGVAVVLLGIALWGLHMGLTQGLLAAMVADTAPVALRGSAFGLFHFVSGLVTLLASLLAGALWEWRGPTLTFVAGAVFAAVALAGLLWWRLRFDDRAQRPTQDGSAI
jgi:MFS family permease